MNEVPEGPLIEAHNPSWVIVIGVGCRVVTEEGHVPVAVVPQMQDVQVVGREIDLGLWMSPEVCGKLLWGMGHVLMSHILIDKASGGSENLKHPLSRIGKPVLQTV